VAGQMGQGILDRNPRTEDLGQDISHKTSLIGHLAQDIRDRTSGRASGTGQLGEDSRDRSD
jgi:hypothetical protein